MPSGGVAHDDRAMSIDESLFIDTEFRTHLRELPPSAKLVAKVLDVTGPLDQAQLAEKTLLPDRTVQYVLNQLDDAELMTSHVNLQDT